MRVRDILIVFVAFLAALFGWSQEGSLSLKPSFAIELDQNRYSSHYTPVKPIVTDLNNDNKNELIALDDNGDYIGLFATSHLKAFGDNHFIRLQSKKGISVSGVVVALAAGHLETPQRAKARIAKELKEFKKREREPYKGDKPMDPLATFVPAYPDRSKTKVIAYLNEYYQLTLVDHEFKVLWQRDIYSSYINWITPHSGSLLIRPERIYHQDVGVVIVQVPVGGVNGTEATLFAAFDGRTGETRWSRIISDYAIRRTDAGASFDRQRDNELFRRAVHRGDNTPSFMNVAKDEQEAELLMKNGSEASGDMSDIAEKLRLPNRTAAPPDEQVADALIDGMILNEKDLDSIHAGETPWTNFREAIIATMPHRYSHVWDARLLPSVFHRTKDKSKNNGGKSIGRNDHAALRTRNKDKRILKDEDDVGELGEMLALNKDSKERQKIKNRQEELSLRKDGFLNVNDTQRARRRAKFRALAKTANVVVSHGRDGITVLHLYTGKILTRMEPLRSRRSIYHDVDDDSVLDEITNNIGHRQNTQQRIIYSPNHPPIVRNSVTQDLQCAGAIYRGVPEARDALFNATICDTPGIFGNNMLLLSKFVTGESSFYENYNDHNNGAGGADVLSMIGSHNMVREQTSAVTPTIVQRRINRGRGLFLIKRLAVFMVDTGLVTAMDATSHRVAWRTQTESSFEGLREHVVQSEGTGSGLGSSNEKETRARPFPHLRPMSMRVRTLPSLRTTRRAYREQHPYVIAAGEKHLTLLNTGSGAIEAVVDLPQAPIAPTIVADFNGDGINDVMIVTRHALFGYLGVDRRSGKIVPLLMTLLVGLIALLFIAREAALRFGQEEAFLGDDSEAATARVRKAKRSTD